MPRQPHQIVSWLHDQRWLVAIFIGALVVRLHWNLEVHPLGAYLDSDMYGYVNRAVRLLNHPSEPHEYSSFYPAGTHILLAVIMRAFGPDNFTAVGVIYALIGAGTVALAYAVARRASHFSIVPPLVGLLGVFYYPHISLGGYILSEPPFMLCLMGTLLFAMRMADRGSRWDAFLMGGLCGLGAVFRPQILLSAAFVGLFWLARRKDLPRVSFRLLVLSGLPIALVLSVSAGLLHFNTGRWGLVSENSSINLVFGRCHNEEIDALPDEKGRVPVHFGIPAFLQIDNHEAEARRRRLPPEAVLNPAIGKKIQYKGYIGDRAIHMDFVRRCVDATGLRGQLAYSWLHVKLLWLHNVPWPDSAHRIWRGAARWWTYQHRVWLAVPGLLGLAWMFVPGQRAAKLGLVAVNLAVLLLVAAVYFGGTRHRAVYDYVIMILAFETMAAVSWVVLRALRRIPWPWGNR